MGKIRSKLGGRETGGAGDEEAENTVSDEVAQ